MALSVGTQPSSLTASCALVAFALAYAPVFMRAPGMYRRAAREGFGAPADVNVNPRALLNNINAADDPASKYLARLSAAHNNQLEGLPWFYGALVFGCLCGVPLRTIDAVALVYVIARIGYIVAYSFGTTPTMAGIRSMLWFSCVAACVVLFSYAAAVAPRPVY